MSGHGAIPTSNSDESMFPATGRSDALARATYGITSWTTASMRWPSRSITNAA
jgi:hypothetical protein